MLGGGAALVGVCVDVYGAFELVGGADVGVFVGVDGEFVGVVGTSGVFVGDVGVSGVFVGDVGTSGVFVCDVGVGNVVVGPIGGLNVGHGGGIQPGYGGRQPGNGMMIGIGIGPFGLGTKPGVPGLSGAAGTGATGTGVSTRPGATNCGGM